MAQLPKIVLNSPLRRIAVALLSTAVVAVPAQAPPERWTLVLRDSGIAYYIDKRTVTTEAVFLAYWVLVDFDYASQYDGANPYKSARLLQYALCDARVQDTKSFLQHYAQMGRGEPGYEVTFEDRALRMEPLEAGSVGARLLEAACGASKE